MGVFGARESTLVFTLDPLCYPRDDIDFVFLLVRSAGV